MVNYGSKIKFAGKMRSRGKGKSYRWIAHASPTDLETVFINEHEMWTDKPINYVINKVMTLIPHENIHCILYTYGLDPFHGYDVVRGHLIHKRKCSQYLRNIYYRMC